jgi:hypothetical protein
MEVKKLKQITNQLRKSLDNWDYNKAILFSKDETQTRDNLIHPFLNILGFNKLDDYSHEYIADIGEKKGKRVDIAITLGKKTPSIIVECKSSTKQLTIDNFRQLNEYCLYTPSAKIGILTNGLIYNFYSLNNREKKGLNSSPFFTFDLQNFDNSHIEQLTLFYRPDIEIVEILSVAEETYFLNDFDNSLANVLIEKTELAKLIVKNMGVKGTERILSQVQELINSSSIKTATEKLITKEISQSNTGIITTEEEVKAYNVVKTILAMSPKIKENQLARIGYRDLKNVFIIIVDGKQTKNICSIVFKGKTRNIEINGETISLKDVTIAEITKLKKQLIDSAITQLGIG